MKGLKNWEDWLGILGPRAAAVEVLGCLPRARQERLLAERAGPEVFMLVAPSTAGASFLGVLP